MKKLTLPQAREMVAEILQAAPATRFNVNFGSDSCRYFSDDGTPVCVVGYVFARLGIGPDDLMVENVAMPNTAVLAAFRTTFWNRIDDDAWRFLSEVQMNQDSGLCWAQVYIKMYQGGETVVQG